MWLHQLKQNFLNMSKGHKTALVAPWIALAVMNNTDTIQNAGQTLAAFSPTTEKIDDLRTYWDSSLEQLPHSAQAVSYEDFIQMTLNGDFSSAQIKRNLIGDDFTVTGVTREADKEYYAYFDKDFDISQFLANSPVKASYEPAISKDDQTKFLAMLLLLTMYYRHGYQPIARLMNDRLFQTTEGEVCPEEEYSTAVHEAGHAILMLELENELPYTMGKISIVKDGHSLGRVHHTPKPGHILKTLTNYKADIAVGYGGYLAEKLFLSPGSQSEGAVGDLQMISGMVNKIVKANGLATNVFPANYYMLQENTPSQLLNESLNAEALAILNECFQRAENILQQNHTKLLKLADELVQRKTMDPQEVHSFLATTAQPSPQMDINFN
ncbi:MAG TPA: hypothetical protein DIU06_02660 [Rhodospirillaceae bacterium]|nr:hypothetical protein [Rhodospirillaceae bacterium]|tara:strand:+ start:50642 stop:51787 length:1146 start_codon:yes stop_codon:yes gene_type:complete